MADRDYDPNAPEEKRDVVRVKAIERGFTGTLIRNPGDVFLMDTKHMRQYPPKMHEYVDAETGEKRTGPIGGPIPGDATIITTPRGEFELPTWVVEAPPEAVLTTEVGAPKDTAGHHTTFGKLQSVL